MPRSVTKMSILFLCPYPPGVVPSQRFRFEQYLNLLERYQYNVMIKPFFTEQAWKKIRLNRSLLARSYFITLGIARRISLLFRLSEVDFIFIHREAIPLGPPLMEWLIARVLRKKIIYDFDDAIWLTDNVRESAITAMMRCRSKVRSICKWSHKVSCGNAYLARYAEQFATHVIINPTTIDTLHLDWPAHPSVNIPGKPVTIGWTGSHSTLKYLQMIVPVLKSIEIRYPDVRFLVISDRNPKLALHNFRFAPWSKETEITDLAHIDIGVMPLPDDPWTRGKCGFKALQYMSLQIPAVVSPVGVNREIVTHEEDGYHCSTMNEWYFHLEKLILDGNARRRMGEHGRQRVLNHYSVKANSENFLSLFQ